MKRRLGVRSRDQVMELVSEELISLKEFFSRRGSVGQFAKDTGENRDLIYKILKSGRATVDKMGIIKSYIQTKNKEYGKK